MDYEEFYGKPVHERLVMLRDWVKDGCHEPNLFNTRYGICTNADLESEEKVLFVDWPHYSGDFSYPVEGSGELYREQHNKYDAKTCWGQRRLQLLDYLIEATAP